MTVKELLLSVPGALKDGAVAPDSVVQFETEEPVHYVVQGGVVTSREGHAPAADVTVRVKSADLVRMIEGRLNPMTALMTGRLKVKGDLNLAKRLISSIDKDKLLGDAAPGGRPDQLA